MNDEGGLAFSSSREDDVELERVVEQRNLRFLELVERCGIEPINRGHGVDAHIMSISIKVDDHYSEYDWVEVVFGVFDYIDRRLASLDANVTQ